MRVRRLLSLTCCSLLLCSVARAQTRSQVGSALQASNLLNPNISIVGWFQGEAGRRSLAPGQQAPSTFEFKEAEIAFQSIVDPYARADLFVAVEGEGNVELEEATLTWFSLPHDLALKIGKMKANFGKFNRVHRPETAFADRPLVHENYFGEEGLSSVGGSLSWHLPNPWLFLNLDAEVLTMPEAAEAPAFEKAERKDLLYVGRLGGYYDLTDAANLTMGGTFAYGAAGQNFDAVSSSTKTLRSRLYGVDFTFRWKNPRRAIYRSLLWQTEFLWNNREASPGSSIGSFGMFSHLEYQFARRWRAGGRYDWSESPTNSTMHDHGGLLYLTFMPSEFSLISLQGRHVKKGDGSKETLGWLKVTFSIGPHGTHPF